LSFEIIILTIEFCHRRDNVVFHSATSTSYISASDCAGFIVLISEGLKREERIKISRVPGRFLSLENVKQSEGEVHSSRVIKQSNKRSTKKRLE